MKINNIKVRRVILIFALIFAFFISHLASFGLTFVEYHGSIVYMTMLKGHEVHCVQKSLGNAQGILGLLKSFPPFICFDTIADADAWMNMQLKR